MIINYLKFWRYLIKILNNLLNSNDISKVMDCFGLYKMMKFDEFYSIFYTF